nr:hypothetical protein [Microctonus hyperodae filamentous virus]
MSHREYNIVLQRIKFTFPCKFCENVELVPKTLVQHLKDEHADVHNWKHTCPWCCVENVDWSHRLQCLRQMRDEKKTSEKERARLKRKYPKMPTVPVDNEADNDNDDGESMANVLAAICRALQPPVEFTEADVNNFMYNSEQIDRWWHGDRVTLHRNMFGEERFDEYPTLYENLNDEEKKPEWLITAAEGVNERYLDDFTRTIPVEPHSGVDTFWQQAYLFKRNLSWYHLSVRVQAWPSFYEFCQQFKDDIHFLPYWCLCKGGKMHHRHSIVVMLNSTAEKIMGNVWQQTVRFENAVYNAKFKRKLNPVQHPTYLLNTILYVSNRASMCAFEAEKMQPINEYFHTDEYHGFKSFTGKGNKKRRDNAIIISLVPSCPKQTCLYRAL